LYSPADPAGKQERGLVNEIIGYQLAKAGQLQVPQNAGLIHLTGSQLGRKPHWVADDQDEVLAWWSEDVHHPSIKAQFNLAALPPNSQIYRNVIIEISKALAKRHGIEKIVAFDDIVANVDRNLGNVLDTPSELTLIDHGRLLTGPYWKVGDLNPEKAYVNKLRALLTLSGEPLPFKSALVNEIEKLGKLISKDVDALSGSLARFLNDAEQVGVAEFLSKRSAGGVDTAKRIGLVA
jgi:hypothetical protein